MSGRPESGHGSWSAYLSLDGQNLDMGRGPPICLWTARIWAWVVVRLFVSGRPESGHGSWSAYLSLDGQNLGMGRGPPICLWTARIWTWVVVRLFVSGRPESGHGSWSAYLSLDGQNLDMGRGQMLYIVINIMGAASEGSTVGFSGCPFEDVPLVKFMYLYLHACQVRVTMATQVFVVELVLRILSAN